jgi:hypothetical protein
MPYTTTTHRGYTIQTGRSYSDPRAVRAHVYRGKTAEVVAVIDVRGADAATIARRWLDMVLGPDLAAIEAAARAQAEAERRAAEDAAYLERVRAAHAAARQREIDQEIADLMRGRADTAARNRIRYGDKRPVSTPERAARLLGYE